MSSEAVGQRRNGTVPSLRQQSTGGNTPSNNIILTHKSPEKDFFYNQQVDKAAGMLKKFSCQSSNYFVKAQVSYLLHLLEPLQIFDFYGWYRLDYSTLVGVVNLMVTYLVILVQVGDQPLNRQA
ncbi:putative 7tm Chemosensory receptor-containing protein 10 [Homarus americanus]|uniref:Putative 7tm Chemosensory receptor-containing protein 10 n=1 Tax=Homarus americanus TaxID=6706 RepID=A0A8J5JRA7_HOMAM|nr:putative 7tm Chemosensory receptor-containing protein 10 [Homarus americanus]